MFPGCMALQFFVGIVYGVLFEAPGVEPPLAGGAFDQCFVWIAGGLVDAERSEFLLCGQWSAIIELC